MTKAKTKKQKQEPEYFKILLVENNPKDIQRFSRVFSEAFSADFRIEYAESLAKAKQILGKENFHVILLDLFLPDSQGLDTLKSFFNFDFPLPPVIILATAKEELAAIKAVQEGADDYLLTEQVNAQFLKLSVRHAISRHRMTSELERLQFQQRTKSVEKERLKADFLAFASHELRAPLAAIHAFSSLLLRIKPEEVTDVLTDYVSNIAGQAKRMSRLIDDFLDIAKIESGQPISLMQEVFDVRQLVEGIVKTQKVLSPRRVFEVTYDPGVETLRADRDKALQILVNLITNADKYSPLESAIKIRVVNLSSDLCFEINNQGDGISKETAKKLFTPYYRSEEPAAKKVRGVGIGLFLCKHLVEAHGGKIWVNSDPNLGTTFSFTLPK